MPTVLASAVLARVATLLRDSEFTHWTEDELLIWLNDGQRDAASLNPSLYVRSADLSLVPGTKQALPEDAKRLLDMPRNTGGAVIYPIARQALDSQLPDWHSQAKADARVVHFCYSASDLKTFYVYPPSPGGNRVELIYEAIPPTVALGAPIALDDSYVSALVDFVMFRAAGKDSEYAPSASRAALHYQAFQTAVTGKAPPAPQ